MAAVAIDSLEYAHQLEAVGMPREQAEAVAKGLTTMFVHNFDSLVTKDYLDTRFTEFETRVDANIDKRFAEVDRRFHEMESNTDRRFLKLETNMDRRFLELNTNMDRRFLELNTNMDRRFLELETNTDGYFADFKLEVHGEIGNVRTDLAGFRSTQKLHSWMFALLIAGIFTPILQNFFS